MEIGEGRMETGRSETKIQERRVKYDECRLPVGIPWEILMSSEVKLRGKEPGTSPREKAMMADNTKTKWRKELPRQNKKAQWITCQTLKFSR